ncbi:unnamed protein product [Ectocarpus sp. 4 AP-2014]
MCTCVCVFAVNGLASSQVDTAPRNTPHTTHTRMMQSDLNFRSDAWAQPTPGASSLALSFFCTITTNLSPFTKEETGTKLSMKFLALAEALLYLCVSTIRRAAHSDTPCSLHFLS